MRSKFAPHNKEVRQGVKEVCKRDGIEYTPGREVKVGKTKTATSKRRVPLNQAAAQAVRELRQERDFGPTAPLVSDEKGGYPPSELPQEVLPDSQGSRHRTEGPPQPQAHIRKLL